MIVLQIKGLEKSFGGHTVFKNVQATLKEREKIALLGVNGSGKSTLLRCLTKEVEADSGEISQASGLKIGYLKQFQSELQGKTLWDVAMQSFESLLQKRATIHALEEQIAQAEGDLEQLLERYARLADEYEREGGYLCEAQARKVLLGLGFEEKDFPLLAENLSGGQKTRLRLACTLIQEPDILILDEPTNHLDIQAVEWLEGYLSSYAGTLLFVSHDRRLVERVASGIWEIRRGNLKTYQGNYSSYLQQRKLADYSLQRAWEKQQAYIQKTEAYIQRYQAGIKSKQARGRASQLDRLIRLESPQEEKQIRRKHMEMNQESGQEVLTAEKIGKAYQKGRPVLQDVGLDIRKGEKVALIGPNGCGKSTLLKILAGKLTPDSGNFKLGSRVEIAWFSQEFEDLHDDWTLFQEISRNFDLDDVEVRNCLGSMLFSEDDVFKEVHTLSGGEKGRLALLKIMLTGANFLMLDEPTNHLDLESREIMEKILQEFPGTLLFVSHDRYFIDQIATRVIVFENGKLASFVGNYSYYREKIEQRKNKAEQENSANGRIKERSAAKQREQQKDQQRKQKKLERRNQALENEIEQLEKDKMQWEQQMNQSQTQLLAEDYANMAQAYQAICTALDEKMEEWASVQEELEQEK